MVIPAIRKKIGIVRWSGLRPDPYFRHPATPSQTMIPRRKSPPRLKKNTQILSLKWGRKPFPRRRRSGRESALSQYTPQGLIRVTKLIRFRAKNSVFHTADRRIVEPTTRNA